MDTSNPKRTPCDTYRVFKSKIIILPTINSKKTQEEMQLEAKLREMTEEKQAVTREAEERLRKIKEEEEREKERLLQIRTERRAARFDSQKKTTKQETELQLELESLKGENNQLKQQVAVLAKEAASDTEELQLLRRKYSDEKTEKDEEIKNLTQHIKCLEDKITAAQQIAFETQQRQLDELHSLTEETGHQTQHQHQHQLQQQQPAAEERHQGKSCTSSLT